MLLKSWTISAAVVMMAACTLATSTEKATGLLTSEFRPGFTKREIVKRKDDDEQDGDKIDEGDDDDSQGPAKRFLRPWKESLATPGSTDFNSASSHIRRGIKAGKHHGEHGSHRNEHESEERGEGQHGDRPDGGREAKQHLKARRRLLAKRTIDSFVNKVGLGVDMLIYKQNKINDKISGGPPPPSPKSDLPDGHSEQAAKAISKAKEISKAGSSGDIKGMHNDH